MQEAGSYPQVLFLFRDSVDCGERFFAKQWPQARAISDASGDWWKTFSVKPVGSLSKLFGPGVFLADPVDVQRQLRGHAGQGSFDGTWIVCV